MIKGISRITSNSMGLFGENDSDFIYGGITFSIAF
jgi:hypothetical protein